MEQKYLLKEKLVSFAKRSSREEFYQQEDVIDNCIGLWYNNQGDNFKGLACNAKTSKSKDRVKSLEGKPGIWKEDNVNELFEEGKVIQDRLKSVEIPNDTVKISKKFRHQMQKVNVNEALKVLTNNMSGGILPLTDEILLTQKKHPIEATKWYYKDQNKRFILSIFIQWISSKRNR